MLEKGNTQLKADMMLVLVTLCWGVSYFMMDLCLQELEPLTLNAIRFIGAFAIAWLLTVKKVIHVNKKTLKYAFFVSVSLIFVYVGATYGGRDDTMQSVLRHPSMIWRHDMITKRTFVCGKRQEMRLPKISHPL